MSKHLVYLLAFAFYFNLAGCGEAAPPKRVRELQAAMSRLKPLHTPMGKPRPGDWLEKHKESGQTFSQYLRARPVTPVGRRRVIYLQPIGDFTKPQRKIVKLTADFLGLWYNRPVKIQDDLPLATIPAAARRKHPQWGDRQILTTYVLNKVLKPRLPKDAAASIGLTATDLWPGEGWNFVFGQASLRDRVGVWSIYRNGKADGDEAERRLCLVRTLKTAAHELGHMFTMQHCTAYECNMCGSNGRAESDRRPLLLCPECLAKTCWATGTDPAKRYRSLIEFCKDNGLKDEQALYEKMLAAIEK